MLKGSFGKTKKAEEVTYYVLRNENGLEMKVLDLGCTIVSLKVPDRDGVMKDVLLGFDTVGEYEESTTYFGAVIGRNANRINEAKCKIGGETYLLEANNFENNLHSGADGFHSKVWKVIDNVKENKIVFRHKSCDGEQGYPGNMEIKVTYELTERNSLAISYEATTDQETIANFTNHAYFNLDGHDAGNIEKQIMMINASNFTPVLDEKSIPTGVVSSVLGTPMDFTTQKPIGKDINDKYDQLVYAGGYDHNYVLNREDCGMNHAASVYSEVTGIAMEVYTQCPGIQFYSGNFLVGEMGKEGCTYHPRQGFCLETQYFPDAINQDNFEKPILKPGEIYQSQTEYVFGIKQK